MTPLRQIDTGVSVHTEVMGKNRQWPVLFGLDTKRRIPSGTITSELIVARGIFAGKQVNFSTFHGGYHVTFESVFTEMKHLPIAFMLRGSRWTDLKEQEHLPETDLTEFIGGVRVKVSRYFQVTADFTNDNYGRWNPSLQILGQF